MTPEQRAKEVCDKPCDHGKYQCRQCIVAAISAAVSEERERITKGWPEDYTPSFIADLQDRFSRLSKEMGDVLEYKNQLQTEIERLRAAIEGLRMSHALTDMELHNARIDEILECKG